MVIVVFFRELSLHAYTPDHISFGRESFSNKNAGRSQTSPRFSSRNRTKNIGNESKKHGYNFLIAESMIPPFLTAPIMTDTFSPERFFIFNN